MFTSPGDRSGTRIISVEGTGTINTVPKWTGVTKLGDSGITDDGRDINITAWPKLDGSTGGSVQVVAGTGGVAGGIAFYAAAGTGLGDGGTVNVYAGTGGPSGGNGGGFQFNSGAASAGNNNGGDFLFVAGAGSGSGVAGKFKFLQGAAQPGALDFSALTSTRTFSFPDTTGTLALLGLAQTWTAVQTFSAKDVHNAGVDLGSSGRLDSQITDSLSAIAFLLKPTNALPTSGAQVLQVQDSTAAVLFSMKESATDGGQVAINMAASGGPNTPIFAVGQKTTNTNIAALQFNASVQWGSQGVTMSGIASAVAGLDVRTQSSSQASNAACIGASIDMKGNAVARNLTDWWGAVITCSQAAGIASAGTITSAGGVLSTGNILAGGTRMPVTNYYGFKAENSSTGANPVTTNAYGFYAAEQTRGGTIKNGFAAISATAGYKCYTIGDQNSWLAWESSSSFSLNSTTVLCKANLDISAKNIATDTTTGTKIGTGTTQKLGFWNATPIAQNTGWSSITNVTTDRAYDANATSLDEIADVLGTLIAQLVSYGILGA